MDKMSTSSAMQLNKILSFLPEQTKEKIPNNIWNLIVNKANNNIDTKINKIEDVKEENIFPETRKYLSFIFINYLATENENQEYKQIVKNNELQYQKFLSKKYNVDDIFRKNEKINNIENEKQASSLPIQYKETFLESVIRKIKKILRV